MALLRLQLRILTAVVFLVNGKCLFKTKKKKGVTEVKDIFEKV